MTAMHAYLTVQYLIFVKLDRVPWGIVRFDLGTLYRLLVSTCIFELVWLLAFTVIYTRQMV
jgi:hypothetical protein